MATSHGSVRFMEAELVRDDAANSEDTWARVVQGSVAEAMRA